MSVIDHLLLGVATVAMSAASIRLASRCVDRGLERILAAATFFVVGRCDWILGRRAPEREPPLAIIDEFRIYHPQPETSTG